MIAVVCSLAMALLHDPALQDPARQDPALRPDDEVARALRSPDAAQLAWGATWAADRHRADLIALLVERLHELEGPGLDQLRAAMQDRAERSTRDGSRPPGPKSPDSPVQSAPSPELQEAIEDLQWTMPRYLLDALVRLQAEIPVERALAWVPRFPAPAMLLLIDREEPALDELEALRRGTADRLVWWACANTLGEARHPAFVGQALREMEFLLRLQVVDGSLSGGAGGGFGSSISCGMLRLAEGFPPLPVWELDDTPRVRDVVLAPGPTMVVARRSTREGPDIGVGSRRQPLESVPALLAVFQHFLHVGEGLEAKMSETVRVGLASPPPAGQSHAQHYLEQAERALARRRFSCRAMVAELVRRRLLPPDEVPHQPVVRVEVVDQRADRSWALPEIPGALLLDDGR